MPQKVAAMVDKVAATLCFMACKVRQTLIKKFFTLAAIFLPLYIIGVLNTLRFGAFVPKVKDFEEENAIYNMREASILQELPA